MGRREIPVNRVRITDAFWSPRQRLMTDVTIPYMEKILRDEVEGAEKSNAITNFKMASGEVTGEFYGMVFQDSDVYKWLEAAAYSLQLKSDQALEKRVDEVVDLIGRCQQADGYINTYFTVKEKENRWKNLLECHELYCAGHLIEAAVALHEAAGKDKLLEIAIRFADHICEKFKREDGIPGHQEIEIALMRLYHTTKNEKYKSMAARFLDLRGQDPEWFKRHTPPHPETHYGGYDIDPTDTAYNQSDVPVRKQTVARGHAVRQMYMLTAMADVASETGDTEMISACEKMFENITQKQMYITGAIGATPIHESFTVDYDLPSDRCYGETCASVAMAFFAHNMLSIKPDGKYADILELELYNAALSGMQLDGKRFFYVNPLSVDTRVSGIVKGYEHALAERPAWHACACCPPNLARLIASLGKYLFSEEEDALYSHLLIGCVADTKFGKIRVESKYPWEGYVKYEFSENASFSLNVRVPVFCENFEVKINGKGEKHPIKNGYACIQRQWQSGDCAEIIFHMPIYRMHADSRIRDAAGKVAIKRGPIVYCMEAADHKHELASLILPQNAEIKARPSESLSGMIELIAEGKAQAIPNRLYCADLSFEPTTIRLIPYFAWSNREKGDMRVWIREN